MVRLLQAWLWLREKGQGLVEYALILVLIAVVVIAILALLGTQVSTVFSQIYSALGGQ
jgi:pilus assembly protein Flp/PilA